MSWVFFALCSMVSYCLFSLCVKFSIDRIDATLMSTIQTWITGIILIFVTLLNTEQPIGASLLAISRKDWGFIILSSIAYSASWVFFFSALKYGPLAKITVIERLDFVLMVFLSALFFGEQITGKTLIGASLMLIGVLLVAQD